jgi:hypothetical protein
MSADSLTAAAYSLLTIARMVSEPGSEPQRRSGGGPSKGFWVARAGAMRAGGHDPQQPPDAYGVDPVDGFEHPVAPWATVD